MVDIYPLQQFVTTFTKAGAYESTTFGGGNPGATAPITGYPEIACGEQMTIEVGTGPSGENVFQKNGTHYYLCGACFLAYGSLAAGQFDLRDTGNGQLTLECDIKTLSAAALDSFYGALIIASGGTAAALADGTGGQTRNNDYVVLVEYFQDSGAVVQWNVSYYRINGGVFSLTELNGSLTLAPFTFDNAWHNFKIKVTPATITGVFSGGAGTPGGATSDTSGSVDFLIDDVSVLSATGIGLIVNKFANTQPELYYGRGHWFGDGGFFAGADLIGPTTNVHMYYASSGPTPPTTPPTTFVNSTACCGSAPGLPSAGATADVVNNPFWIPSCIGGGATPNAPDINLPEVWDY